MYERLQKIMILSVLKHTKTKVKFWLIKNYMSPEMKATMPIMAKEYGFEVCHLKTVFPRPANSISQALMTGVEMKGLCTWERVTCRTLIRDSATLSQCRWRW